ncbi:hypothetical protein Bbelb_359380 [Branchiostoma belcheri]|nr:hypothetical protein Bbelb_359380 [Branchiostoma belcheri]
MQGKAEKRGTRPNVYNVIRRRDEDRQTLGADRACICEGVVRSHQPTKERPYPMRFQLLKRPHPSAKLTSQKGRHSGPNLGSWHLRGRMDWSINVARGAGWSFQAVQDQNVEKLRRSLPIT